MSGYLLTCFYLLEQDVLGLDVAVDDAVRVHEGEHVDELAHHVLRVPLAEGAALHDPVEQRAADPIPCEARACE